MSKIAVIVAMDAEYEPLIKAIAGMPGDIIVRKSGIGKVNAARCATELILQQKPDCIINTGVAGGMVEGMSTGDLVIASQVAYHDVWCGPGIEMGKVESFPQRFDADPKLLSLVPQAIEEMNKVKQRKTYTGLICSGDQFFISIEEDNRIRSLYPDVLAADMESGALAQVCHYYGVPFINCRVLSDIHTSEEVQKATYFDFITNIDAPRFIFLTRFLDLCIKSL